MREIDFMSTLHKSTKRDYLSRVNDSEYPKERASKLAKKFDFDYWDGNRKICYGGYKYIPGRWEKVVKKLIDYYKLDSKSKILDIGCGKGYMLYEFTKHLPNIEICGLDISEYALKNSKEEISSFLSLGNASNLPYDDNYFDLVISINTLHCLNAYDLDQSLREIERVGKLHKYICVESYRDEKEKVNLLYWQVTCEAFNNPESWKWWFKSTGYTGDYSFIYFE